jgi:hypothetical protein
MWLCTGVGDNVNSARILRDCTVRCEGRLINHWPSVTTGLSWIPERTYSSALLQAQNSVISKPDKLAGRIGAGQNWE